MPINVCTTTWRSRKKQLNLDPFSIRLSFLPDTDWPFVHVKVSDNETIDTPTPTPKLLNLSTKT